MQGDTLVYSISNTLQVPIRLQVSSSNAVADSMLSQNFPMLLPARTDTAIRFQPGINKENARLSTSAMFGDPDAEINLKPLRLPFQKEKTYMVIQGFEGSFSHNSDYSRYALDFDLAEGDTILAAADGFVIGVIEEYTDGGNLKKWRDYANFITLYHPEMNILSQYAHLKHMGSLVEVGDSVFAGQPIGLSGKTGYTTTEHLHFNVLRATPDGVASIPYNFEGGIIGAELTKGDEVKHE
jgi:murein DD-endopeptidase MepM/ murein hydrolase activator NlpD